MSRTDVDSSLEVTEQTALGVAVTRKRVSLGSLENKIEEVEYINPNCLPHMTIAVVMMTNGFAIVGTSTTADPANYDVDVGRQFAYENAVRQIWQLEGYLLREKLHKEENPDEEEDPDEEDVF